MTERDLPTFDLTLQLGQRGDVFWQYLETVRPLTPREPGWPSGWADPDQVQSLVRRELAVAIPTWVHRLRRFQQSSDEHSPLWYPDRE